MDSKGGSSRAASSGGDKAFQMSASQLDLPEQMPVEGGDEQNLLPCSISGVFPAISGGALGIVFGGGRLN